MKNKIAYSIAFSFALFMGGCEKDVTLNLPQPPSQICVEGHVEPGQLAWVYLSHNFAFFGTTSISSIIANEVIDGATITVNDGYTTDTMQAVIPALGYYETKSMKGITGRTYNLTVKVNGQTLTATTTILPAIQLDSTWFKIQPGMDTLGYLWATLQDPPQAGNCYRWMVKRLGQDTTFVPPFESAFNDAYINGQKFEFYYSRGKFPGSKAKDDTDAEAGYFKTGETCVIQFSTISYAAYQFYNEYYYQLNNVGNPFGSPAPVQGNINGGLGIWCGYGTFYDTVYCK